MTAWDDAITALALLAIDPALGGMNLRARAGPTRDAFLKAIDEMPQRAVRLHPAMTPDVLDGAIDLTETLRSGKLAHSGGLLQGAPATVVLSMAERSGGYVAGRLCAQLDTAPKSILIALDEGIDDEQTPSCLTDRMAFSAMLDDIPLSEIGVPFSAPSHPLTKVSVSDDLAEQLVLLGSQLGITSLRAASFALRAAKAHAALQGRSHVDETDAAKAVALVFAHRATRIPQESPPDNTPESPQDLDTDQTQDAPEKLSDLPAELLLEAVKAALPPDLLAQLQSGKAQRSATGGGSGAKKTGNRKGRPLPARTSKSRDGARVDIIATLRGAVPWQTIRRKTAPDDPRLVLIYPEDIAHKRFQTQSDRLLIFVVDASGSAALARLREAKGAVELLLADAYARRDYVALIAFRGTDAEVLLPPTRSLVQTKRRLADLPGGGATPLAAGLLAARELAVNAARKGLTPTLVLLTDGRSNIALDGTADRPQAAADAQAQAAALAGIRTDAIVIDTGNRPEPALRALADTLHAAYVPLPRADAQTLSQTITTQLDA